MEYKLSTTIPPTVNKDVIKFCKTISDSDPVFVRVVPERYSRLNDCYPNVKKKIEYDQGKILYGWAIWKVLRLFYEAEHHSIWVSPSEDWIDVTPHLTGDRILFLPDEKTIYNGEHVPNIRFPLVNNQKLEDYFRLAEEDEKLRMKYAHVVETEAIRKEMLLSNIRKLKLQIELGICQPHPEYLKLIKENLGEEVSN